MAPVPSATAVGAQPAAGAQPARDLYYERSSPTGLMIARLQLSGPRRRADLVPLGDVNVFGIAVAGPQIMFSTQAGPAGRGTIWRATRSGPTRQMVGGLIAPASLVATGGFLYWSDERAVGRVSLGGRHPQRHFLTLPQERGGGVVDGLATDNSSLYFTRCTDHSIGRADLNGSHLSVRLIATGPSSCPQGIAVAGKYIYWTDLGSGTIGRAERNGAHADDHWLVIHSTEGPFQVVADQAHVYWTWGGVDGSPAFTGRANTNGSGLNRRFLADSLYPMALT